MISQKDASCQEQQLTFDPRGHQLTNINVWTPDSQWLVYDVRPNGGTFSGLTIERVNCVTRNIEVIYRAQHGAHVGVVTVSPDQPARYVFIHGPEHPDSHWHYDFHHRRGVIVAEPDRELVVTLDAMDITAPYTPGALRGGTHVHVFSPDGSRLSFTYNDHVLHELDPALDCRNVGIALPLHGVNPPKQHPREYEGSHFCVLISRTTPTPQAGSDQINRAYEEGWIGTQGYLKKMAPASAGRSPLLAIPFRRKGRKSQKSLLLIYLSMTEIMLAQAMHHLRGHQPPCLHHLRVSVSGGSLIPQSAAFLGLSLARVTGYAPHLMAVLLLA